MNVDVDVDKTCVAEIHHIIAPHLYRPVILTNTAKQLTLTHSQKHSKVILILVLVVPYFYYTNNI